MGNKTAGLRILITGSRTWTNSGVILSAIGLAHTRFAAPGDPVTLVHGFCLTGADRIADEIGRTLGLTVERHPAAWDPSLVDSRGRPRVGYDKRAGYVRNAEMVKLGADVCLAFIKAGSKGATMCADLAEKAGIPTVRYLED